MSDRPRRSWDPQIDPHFFLAVCDAFEFLRLSCQRWHKTNHELVSPGFAQAKAGEMSRRFTGARRALNVLYRFGDQHHLSLDMDAIATAQPLPSWHSFQAARATVRGAQLLALRHMALQNIPHRPVTAAEREAIGIVDFIEAGRSTWLIDAALTAAAKPLTGDESASALAAIAAARLRGLPAECVQALFCRAQPSAIAGAILELQALRAAITGTHEPLNGGDPILSGWTLIRGLRHDDVACTLTIDGERVRLSADGSTFIGILIQAQGRYVSGTRGFPKGMRADRTRNRLPPVVRLLVDKLASVGYRIIR